MIKRTQFTHTMVWLLLVLFLVITPVLAENKYVFQKDTLIDLNVPVYNHNNSEVGNSVTCFATINYPNGSVMLANREMTFNTGGIFNLTINETLPDISGEYHSTMKCGDAVDFGFSTFIMEINPTGIRPTEERTQATTRSMYFFFAFSLIFFIGFLFTKGKMPMKLTFIGVALILAMIAMNILFVSIQDEVVNPRLEGLFEGLTVISWVMYWGVGMFLAILWIFTFLNTWMYKKQLEHARKFGDAGFGGGF